MMKNRYLTFLIAIGVLMGVSCKKIEKGFLSDNPRYVNGTIIVPRGGVYVASERINADGSTPPFEFKLLNLRNRETGEPAPSEFLTEYEIMMFKQGMVFDAARDTTIELLDKKREKIKTTPFVFNSISGQLVFNRSSANLPLGDYVFDMEMSNVKGNKQFSDFGHIKVVDPTESDYVSIAWLAASASDANETFFDTSAPRVTAERISGEGARIILKIVDKNGTPFDPSKGEIIRRGDRPTFETHTRFNPIIETDTAMICDFEVAPFPMVRYVTPETDWGHLIYYRIPGRFVRVDGMSANLNVNPVFEFQVKMEGTYIVTVSLPTVTRIGS